MLRKKKIYTIPIIAFLVIICVITLLLKLPICNKRSISYIDALFEAASNVTATGSNVVDISQQFTFVGQLVLLFAMQIGAIGFMLFFSIMFAISKKKLKLSDTIFLGNEINTNNYVSIKSKAKKITAYTICVEFFGAWFLALRFVPLYGIKKGLWYSAFHAVSAFCNVGSDLLGNNSFMQFQNDIYLNIVLILLMFMGSLGFFVLEDLLERFWKGKKSKIHVESKLILNISVILVAIGVILLKIFDPQLTMIQALFSIVAARNTGLYTVNIAGLHEFNQFLLIIIMFIGGGPGSNAGGIRVMVLSILILTTIANIRGREEVVVFYRSIPDKMIKKAVTILSVDLMIVFMGTILLSLTEGKGILDTLFYVVSSFSNTGLSTIEVSGLTMLGKCVSIFIMYIGRIAPITFVSLFIPTRDNRAGIKYPNMDVIL